MGNAKSKIIPVHYEPGERVGEGDTGVYQYDKGIILRLEGCEGLNPTTVLEATCAFDTQEQAVPANCEVDDGYILVAVPDICLTKGVPVFAYVTLTEDDSTVTQYEARLSVSRRAKPHDYELSDSDMSEVEALLDAVNTAAERLKKLTNILATVEQTHPGSLPYVEVTNPDDESTSFDFRLPEPPPPEVTAEIRDGDLYMSVNGEEAEKIGRVAFHYRGVYDETGATVYEPLDVVRLESYLYLLTEAIDGDPLSPPEEGSGWVVIADLTLDLSELEQYAEMIAQLQADIEAAREALEELEQNGSLTALQEKIAEMEAELAAFKEETLKSEAEVGDEEKVMWVNEDRKIEPSRVKLKGDHGIILNNYELYVDDYGEVKTRKLTAAGTMPDGSESNG